MGGLFPSIYGNAVKKGAIQTLNTAKVLAALLLHKSYDVVAERFGIWRPLLRKHVRGLVDTLIESEERDYKLLGGALFTLTDTLPFCGKQKSKKAQRRSEDYRHKDPDCLGRFRLRIGETDWQSAFAAHGFQSK
jgi:hypothetical protein